VNYAYLDTSVGTLLIAGDAAAVLQIAFPSHGKAAKAEAGWVESHRGPVGEAVRQLQEYFARERVDFDLPLAPRGTEFQRSVWRVGNSKASRAVGSANGKNPLPIVIPCHRVIAGDGTLGGFGGGLPTKQTLLALEQGASIRNRAVAGR
jgi:methylated-DNA-[protein]-cysteine S-methyltransferase